MVQLFDVRPLRIQFKKNGLICSIWHDEIQNRFDVRHPISCDVIESFDSQHDAIEFVFQNSDSIFVE